MRRNEYGEPTRCFQHLMLLSILTLLFSEATTIYKEVLINAATNITCIPNEDIQIQWHHTATNGTLYYLYAGGRLFVSSRVFRLENDSNTGPYYLVIPHVRTEDAGLYECKEDSGSRVFGSTHLTVLESNPICNSNMKPEGYVGQNTCSLEDDMTLTCAVSFNGKPPRMIWKTLNGSQSFNKPKCKTENGRINCSLTVKADSKYDGSIFNCQSTKSTAECNTRNIKIQNFERQMSGVVAKNLGDKVNCSVNVKSTQRLQFKWTLLQGDQHVFLTNDQELAISSFGVYRCTVEYLIGNGKCTTIVTDVNAQEEQNPNTTPCPLSTATMAAIIGLSLFAFILIVAIIVLVLCYRTKIFEKCCSNRSNNGPDSTLLKRLNPQIEREKTTALDDVDATPGTLEQQTSAI